MLGSALVMQLSESFLLSFFPKLLLAMVFTTAVDIIRANETAQPVKVLAAMPEEVDSNPRIYIHSNKLSLTSVLHMCTVALRPTRICKINKV